MKICKRHNLLRTPIFAVRIYRVVASLCQKNRGMKEFGIHGRKLSENFDYFIYTSQFNKLANLIN